MNKIKSVFAVALLFGTIACQAQPDQKQQGGPSAVTTTSTATTTTTTAAPATAPVQTQNIKIGYTNVDYVLSLMPESKQIESDLKAYSTQLETQLEGKVKEFQTKLETFQKGEATMAEVVRNDKRRELEALQEQIQDFQKNADASLQKKQQQLLEPALDKLQKAIDDVAKENGYTYVFNSDAGYGTTPILLHGPEEHNISDLVLKRLGVTPPAKDASGKPVTGPGNSAPAAPAAKPNVPPATPGKKKK